MFLLIQISLNEEQILQPHTSYALGKQSAKQIRGHVKLSVESARVPPSNSPPSILVVPGWTHGMETDRGIASALRSIQPHIDKYDTIVVLGGYYPEQCGTTPPSTPLSTYWGDKVETAAGSFDIDVELRQKLSEASGQKQRNPATDELVQDSSFFDQPMLWLRAILPEGKIKQKVLPVLLYATLRDQVQFAAQVLSDKLFRPSDKAQFGLSADGKRYLLIVPIQVSQGLELFENVYIENILLDLTVKNKVQDFEQWLFYLTGNTNAKFSNTIASQILLVRLSAIAQKTLTKTGQNDPEWKWRMLDYYTTFDQIMDKEKMIKLGYRDLFEEEEDKKAREAAHKAEAAKTANQSNSTIDQPSTADDSFYSPDQFNTMLDSPTGHQIYYCMSLSLEQPLFTSEVQTGSKKVVSRMPVPIASPEPFSHGAMDELMYAAQLTMRGRRYKKIDAYKRFEKELTQAAPYSIRVYVLAENLHAKDVFSANSSSGQDLTGTCQENVIFEVLEQNFFPKNSVIDSILQSANKIYEEKLNDAKLGKFKDQLLEKYKQMVKDGKMQKKQLKELDLNLADNLIVEIQIYHSWEYKELFSLTEARGQFIALWDGRSAICEPADSKPANPSNIFFRLTQCSLKGGLDAWDWQRGVVHVFDRVRLTKPVFKGERKNEL